MLNKRIKVIFVILLVAAAILVADKITSNTRPASDSSVSQSGQATNPSVATSTQAILKPAAILSLPLDQALQRITKKPFGIYITPQTSPVQPERFKGYHTGVDFETYSNEQNIDVPVSAVCDGKLLLKKWASGYGGVAVQSCVINNQPVTVIYGHLRLSSITEKVGDTVQAGKQIAVLGTGYSTETDGERKHLHLGIHKGTSVNILGYVQNKSDLSGWLDAEALLPK